MLTIRRPGCQGRRAAHRPLALSLAAAGCVATAACVARDRPLEPPTEPTSVEDIHGLTRLTWNPGLDVSPAWLPAGRALSYVGRGLVPATPATWQRLVVDYTGGTSRELLPALRTGPGAVPLPVVPAPRGPLRLVAEARTLLPGCGCGGLPWSTAMVLRVAVADTTQALRGPGQLPHLDLPLIGRSMEVVGNLPVFQALFTEPLDRRENQGAAIYGPSWAPSGDRLVVSDGSDLWIWTVGDSSATPLHLEPDAVFPRWSPDGSRILFTRYTRDSLVTGRCFVCGPLGCSCRLDHSRYITRTPGIWTVRPDGSEEVRLTDGSDANWSPGGDGLVVSRGDGLWVLHLPTRYETPIPRTVGAREPVFSPDGRLIAFSADWLGSFDLWTVRLAH